MKSSYNKRKEEIEKLKLEAVIKAVNWWVSKH
jgi:hypothetical protein